MPKRPRTESAAFVALRGVSWATADGWVNREEGDDVSDAPARAITEWLELDPPAVALGTAAVAGEVSDA